MKKIDYSQLIPMYKVWSDKSIKYGLFTRHELESALICYDSDFGELFSTIENFKGTKLRTELIKCKTHFTNRYLEQPEKNAFQHINIKLMTFLENAILDLSTPQKHQNIYDDFRFEDFFHDK